MIYADKFNFFIPIDMEKAVDEKTGKKSMKFKGVASTADKDSDEEELIPEGFDLSYFKKYGLVNWHHQTKDNPSAIIGYPTDAKIKDGKMLIEGELYEDSPLAQKVYALGEMLEKVPNGRRLGFSIEGKALDRDPLNKKRITKARITGVAITHQPKNANTLMSIMKGECENDFVQLEYEEIEKAEANGGQITYLLDFNDGEGNRITVDKHFNISVMKKALTTDVGSGKGLIKEDLEHEIKNIPIFSHGSKVNQKELNKAILTIVSAHDSGLIEDSIFEETKELIKAEGSRGGKIIGHTKSGKPIYESKVASHEAKYTSQDHKDASYAHLDKSTEYGKAKNHSKADYHSDEFDRHMRTAKHKQINESLT